MGIFDKSNYIVNTGIIEQVFLTTRTIQPIALRLSARIFTTCFVRGSAEIQNRRYLLPV